MGVVKYSQRAKKDLENVLQYLKITWPVNVTDDFLDSLEQLELQMQSMPDSFPSTTIKSKLFKRARLTKHNAVYFTIKGKTINIAAIHDTSQKNKHPKKLK